MKRLLIVPVLLAPMLLLSIPSQAALFLFEAQLTSAEEVPPNDSPATGFGTVVLDDTALTISVDLTFTGLTTPSTVAHIHEAAFGQVGPPEFPLDLGTAQGQQSGTIPHQVLPLLEGAEDVEEFLDEEYYFNVHSTLFPDGEIRGQVLFVRTIPEPTMLLLLGLAGFALVAAHLAVGAKLRTVGRSATPGLSRPPE